MNIRHLNDDLKDLERSEKSKVAEHPHQPSLKYVVPWDLITLVTCVKKNGPLLTQTEYIQSQIHVYMNL